MSLLMEELVKHGICFCYIGYNYICICPINGESSFISLVFVLDRQFHYSAYDTDGTVAEAKVIPP